MVNNVDLENKRLQFWFCCHMLSGNFHIWIPSLPVSTTMTVYFRGLPGNGKTTLTLYFQGEPGNGKTTLTMYLQGAPRNGKTTLTVYLQ